MFKCGWGEGARGVVWEQVKLKRKQGPDPRGSAGPTRSLILCEDDKEQLKVLRQRSEMVRSAF